MAEAASRTFTINFGPQHPAAHGVLHWSPPLPLPLPLSFDSEEKRKQDPSRLSGNAILRGRDKCPFLRIRTKSLRTAVSVSGKRELPARDKRAGKAAKIRMGLGRDDHLPKGRRCPRPDTPRLTELTAAATRPAADRRCRDRTETRSPCHDDTVRAVGWGCAEGLPGAFRALDSSLIYPTN